MEIQTTELCNDYVHTLKVYVNTVDTLLGMSGNLCYWTKEGSYANFRLPAFKTVLEKKGRGENYRYYMRHFRILGWIVCTTEKFSNLQWIKGKTMRTITVDYKKYQQLKQLLDEGVYFTYMGYFLHVVEQILRQNEKGGKLLYIPSKGEKIINVNSSDYRFLMKKECETMNVYKMAMEICRDFEWIICRIGSFTNIQKINGKVVRVVSVDFEKYQLMQELLEGKKNR